MPVKLLPSPFGAKTLVPITKPRFDLDVVALDTSDKLFPIANAPMVLGLASTYAFTLSLDGTEVAEAD